MSCSSSDHCSAPKPFCSKGVCSECTQSRHCPKGFTCVRNKCLRGVGKWWNTMLGWWDNDRKRRNIKSMFLLLLALGLVIIVVMVVFSSMNSHSPSVEWNGTSYTPPMMNVYGGNPYIQNPGMNHFY